MYALALRLCRKAEDAEDLVQEIFLRAFRHWHQFDGRSSPTTWLYTIAVRACRRMHRRRAGQPRRIGSLEELAPFGQAQIAVLPADGGAAVEKEVRREAVERVEEAVAALPPEFRLPLIFKDILGLSVEDTAAVLDLKPATVKTRAHRARLRVRNALSAGLPRRALPPPAYSRQVCLDLLRAKQDALDRGVAFPVRSEIVCERCRAVFDTLDLTRDVCAAMGAGKLPPDVRRRLGELLRRERG